MSSSFSGDQLQPDDTLDDRGVDDVLDEGMSPPERPSPEMVHGRTPAEAAAGETLDDRLQQEEPDPALELEDADDNADPTDGPEVGGQRTGRLTAAPGDRDDDVAEDVGIDGAAASAEEAAVHTIDDGSFDDGSFDDGRA
jgi:hypothetical protein